MIPHKTARGAAALDRFKTDDGIPHPYDLKKKQVVPSALKVLKMKPHRKYRVLGNLSQKVGWKCKDLLEKLEDRRRVRAGAFFERKKKLQKVRKSAAASAKLSADEKALIAKA